MRLTKGRMSYNNKNAGDWEMTYPDEVVFVYNPLYLDIRLENNGDVKVEAIEVEFSTGGKTERISVKLYDGCAKVYYSRILELFFEDCKRQRYLDISVMIKHVGGLQRIYAFTHKAIFGSVKAGERFDGFGAFRYDAEKPYLFRRRVWFKKFPFTVTLFQKDETKNGERTIRVRRDYATYAASTPVLPPQFTMIGEVRKLTGVVGSITDSPSKTQVLQSIMFATDLNCFVGIWMDGGTMRWGSIWRASGIFKYSSEYYNDENSYVRTDMKWGFTSDNSFYRFDNSTERLVKEEIGCYNDFGLFEVNPALTFPNARHRVVYRQDPPGTQGPYVPFTEEFDYTFHSLNEAVTLTHLDIREEETGYYLRWMDNFGCYQYFLFALGETDIKNSISKTIVPEEGMINGMHFSNHNRDMRISTTDTRKCQANSLPDDIFAYVSSVVSSPIVDLYLGKTKCGEEMWVPVVISGSSHKYKPKEARHNLEISFTMPDIITQSL